MLHARTRRKHQIAPEDKVAKFFKRDGPRSGQFDPPRRANCFDRGRDGCGIDGGRFVASQTQQYRAIRAVAQAGQRQRAVKLHLHAGNALEHSAAFKFSRKPTGRAHGPHGMGTRRTDADLVEVEEARRHG